MVAELLVSQNFRSDNPNGSKYPRIGLHFLAKTLRSSTVSEAIEALVKLAPLGVEGAKAAADPAKRDARRSFMVNFKNPGVCRQIRRYMTGHPNDTLKDRLQEEGMPKSRVGG